MIMLKMGYEFNGVGKSELGWTKTCGTVSWRFLKKAYDSRKVS
jgi:hypothetical protein